jgi:ribosome-binding factor A
MFIRLLSVSLALAFSAFLFGCGGTETANSSNMANTTNAANSSNPLETTKKSSSRESNDAPTLTPLFKAYCDAKLKKDEAALRKIFSQGTIKSFEEQMKEDKIKTLVAFLEDEKVSEKLCQVKDEKITGDTAVAKVFYDSYPNGLDVYFEKENGEWKMTNKSPTFEADRQSKANTAPSANTNSSK